MNCFSYYICVIINILYISNVLSGNEFDKYHPINSFPSVELNEINKQELETDFWLDNGKRFVEKQTKFKENKNKAKNIIYFLGDGMSLATLTATRASLGNENESLFFEKFEHTGLSKTYCLDRIVPDSACTSTAYLSGVKAIYGTIGFNGHVKRKNCTNALEKSKYTESIAKWAQDGKKATGFVTTTRVTHATPAGLYAHVTERDWENDAEVKATCGSNMVIPDIAHQLVHSDVGQNFNVIFGGGRQEFHGKKEDDEQGKPGLRTDERNLIQEWEINAVNKREKATYIHNKEQLMNTDFKNYNKVLGLFNYNHMPYHALMNKDEFPTLSEMTQKAVQILKDKAGDNGFFLFVEGGKIDLAHHKVRARLAFDETLEFAKAVEVARNMTNPEDTLIVVTSDHSHTMSISGYAKRSSDIFGSTSEKAEDGLEYLTLNYGNGRAFSTFYNEKKNKRKDPTKIDLQDPKSEFPSTIKLGTETHGGEDVAVFATGPFSHLFTGVYEQSVIPHLIGYAGCIGKGLKMCDSQ